MALSLLTTDSWQKPHELVGSGEHVAAFEQWPFALQGIALAAFDCGCVLSSGGRYKSASQLPVGG